MTARGKVSRLAGDRVAVEVVRESACVGDCASCHGCAGQTVEVMALCDKDVQVGSVVEISSRSGYVYAVMVLLFLLPVLLPIFGYIIFSGFGKTVAVIAAVLLFAVVLATVFAVSRSKRCVRLLTPSVTNILNK